MFCSKANNIKVTSYRIRIDFTLIKDTYPNVVQTPANFFDVAFLGECHPTAAEEASLWLRVLKGNSLEARIAATHLKKIRRSLKY